MQNTPLHPLVEWGRARFGGPEVAPERRLAELEQLLDAVQLDAAKYAPLLAPMVGIPLPPDRLPKLSPDEIGPSQLAAMVDWAIAGARNQPLILIYEDLQWFDPTSIDLVHALSDAAAQAPILMMATARPEFRPPWGLKPHHRVISLPPLDEAQVQRMIAELAIRRTLSGDVMRRVGERAGGVPLFVEEVTRLILERGERRAAQAIPPTLRQSLAARLDRLGSAREVAQIGAVLGRSFSYALLRDVAAAPEPAHRGLDEASLKSALASLADADLVFVDGAPPEATYRFRHALIQDAAYDSLLRSRRQELHRRAAAALIAAESEPEAIARHFTAAGAKDMATESWGDAGEEALRRSAFKEAMAHLGKAIALADEAEREVSEHAPKDPSLASRQLKLHTDYGHAAMWLKGFAADEMSAAYARASEFAGPEDDGDARFVAQYGECLKSFMRGELHEAHAAAKAFVREAKAERRAPEAGVGRRVLGFVSLMLGDLQAARTVLERALSDYVRERDRETLFRFGNDTQVSASNFLALTEWHLGEPDRARQLIDKSTRRANEFGHAAAIASALNFKTVIESRRGDVPGRAGRRESLLQLTQEHNMKTYADLGRIYANWARGKLHDPEAGAVGLKEALEYYLALGNKSGAPLSTVCSQSLKRCGRIWTARSTTIDAGLAMAEETGEHYTDPYLYRLRGEFLLMRSPADPLPPRKLSRPRSQSPRGKARGAIRSSPPVARQALPIDRPFRRGAGPPRARARRLFADAGNA